MMTKRDELLALAEWCEAAAGPDRMINIRIENALGIAQFKREPDTLIGDSDYVRVPAKPYTASLDAAMMLVPDTLPFEVTRTSRGLPDEAFVWNGLVLGGGDHGSGSTPALALCAASLRARAEKDEQ